MGIVWALAGAGAAGMALGFWLFVRALRHRRDRVFGLLGGVALILVSLILLACYLPVFVLPDVAAQTGVFNRPAPLDASAIVFYLSPADVYGPTPGVPTDTLIAVAARTGAIRWQRTLPGTQSQLAVEGDVAYVATRLAQDAGGIGVAAYRGADGAPLWQATVAGSIVPHTDVAAAGDAVYLLTAGGQQTPQTEIIALGASTGTRLWSAEGDADADVSAARLIAASDAVYLVVVTGLRAYRASDGKLLWTHARLAAAPLVGAGVAYLPLYDGGFAAVRAADGSVICQVGGTFDVESAALDGDTLYLAGLILGPQNPPYPSAVYAYEAATCAPRWHVANVGGGLATGDGAVYVQALTNLIALRGSDGMLLWRSDTVTTSLRGTGWAFAARPAALGSTLFATSAVLSGGIHVLGSDGWIHLYAFAGETGFEYWNVPIGHRTTFLAHLTY